MYQSRQPEARTGRDGIPVELTGARADRRAKRALALQPLTDGVRELSDSFDALAVAARNWERPAEHEDARPPTPIDDAFQRVTGGLPETAKPSTSPIDDAFAALRDEQQEVPVDPFGQPVVIGSFGETPESK
jgi:hypothetical protein